MARSRRTAVVLSDADRKKPDKKRPEFPCQVEGCDKLFGRSCDMQRHVDTVHGGKLFWCPFDGCEWEGAKRRYILEHHKVAKHSEQNNVSLDVPDQFLRWHGSAAMLEPDAVLPAPSASFASWPQSNPQIPAVIANTDRSMEFCITGVGQLFANVQLESFTATVTDRFEEPVKRLSEANQMPLDPCADSLSIDMAFNYEAQVMGAVRFDADSFWRCGNCGGFLDLFVPQDHQFRPFPCNCIYTL